MLCVGYFRTRLHQFSTSIIRLNLFKEENDRTERSIRQQKIITRIYLILLIGMNIFALHVITNLFVSLIGTFLGFALYTSLSTETTTITVSNPSFNTYEHLQLLHSNTLTCPCSTMTIRYHTFIKIFPILHQVCSSTFVSKSWISILMSIINQDVPTDWRNQAGSQFQLLSDLCQLAKKTSDDAVRRFNIQYFITSNLLPESDFYVQINATLDQYFHSTIIYFDQLIDTVHLHMQVDQPFMHLGRTRTETIANIIPNIKSDEITGQKSIQVNYIFHQNDIIIVAYEKINKNIKFE